MTIRRARPDDAAVLAKHRAAVWTEGGNWTAAQLAGVFPQWKAFFSETLAAGTCVAWIALDDDAAIGSGALLLQLAIPRPGSPSRTEGRVHSVYVVPARRRQGIARAIMDAMLRYAREAQIIRLKLHPSEIARPLYEAVGFVALDEMGLQLTGD